MSEDARNSIYLWVGGLAFFGLFWAALHFQWPIGVSDKWLWPIVGIVAVINISQTLWGLYRLRAYNPDNPNRTGR